MLFSQLYTQAGNTALVNDVTLAKQAVNDAIREIVMECAWNYSETPTLPLTNGVYKYSILTLLTPTVRPPLKIHYIRYLPAGQNSISSIIYPITVEELLERQSNAANISTGYGGCFAVAGLDMLYLSPTPSTGDSIVMYISDDFTDIASDITSPTYVPLYLHYGIVWIAARNLAAITNSAMVQEFEPLAQAAIAKCKLHANTWSSRRPQRARVGYPQAYSQGRRAPGQYWTGDG